MRLIVIQALQQIGVNGGLQDDYITIHRTRLVNVYIQQAQVTRMHWPSNSPDLNPAEHVWGILDHRLRDHNPPSRNLQHLLAMLQVEWVAFSQRYTAKLIRSMRNRCLECSANRGGHPRNNEPENVAKGA